MRSYVRDEDSGELIEVGPGGYALGEDDDEEGYAGYFFDNSYGDDDSEEMDEEDEDGEDEGTLQDLASDLSELIDSADGVVTPGTLKALQAALRAVNAEAASATVKAAQLSDTDKVVRLFEQQQRDADDAVGDKYTPTAERYAMKLHGMPIAVLTLHDPTAVQRVYQMAMAAVDAGRKRGSGR